MKISKSDWRTRVFLSPISFVSILKMPSIANFKEKKILLKVKWSCSSHPRLQPLLFQQIFKYSWRKQTEVKYLMFVCELVMTIWDVIIICFKSRISNNLASSPPIFLRKGFNHSACCALKIIVYFFFLHLLEILWINIKMFSLFSYLTEQ